MKKRIGFVSNSSSSSFCIYGYEISGIYTLAESLIESDKAKTLLAEALGEKNSSKSAKELFEELKEKEGASEALYALGIDSVIDGESNYVYLGRDYRSLRDEETGLEFRRAAFDCVEEFFSFKGKTAGYICEVIYS